jgi:hypothetical protein
MNRLDDRDLWAGIVLAAIGVAALLLGADLTQGTAADMGEGYVPRAMALALIALGALIGGLALRRGLGKSHDRFEGVRLRPIAFVSAAVLVFAATLSSLGVVVAIAATSFTANFAGQPLSWRALIALVVVLTAGVVAIFVWGLGLPLRILPPLA